MMNTKRSSSKQKIKIINKRVSRKVLTEAMKKAKAAERKRIEAERIRKIERNKRVKTWCVVGLLCLLVIMILLIVNNCSADAGDFDDVRYYQDEEVVKQEKSLAKPVKNIQTSTNFSSSVYEIYSGLPITIIIIMIFIMILSTTFGLFRRK